MAKKAPKKQQPSGVGWITEFRDYVEGVKRELRLVTWPNREQVIATTGVVLVTVFVFALFFGVVDYLLAYGQRELYDAFTRQG